MPTREIRQSVGWGKEGIVILNWMAGFQSRSKGVSPNDIWRRPSGKGEQRWKDLSQKCAWSF